MVPSGTGGQAVDSVIISEPGCYLGRTSERLVVRGPRPRREAVDDEQLSLPLDLPPPPPLAVVTSSGVVHPDPPLRRRRTADGKPLPKTTPDQIELPLFRISEIVIAARGVSMSTDLIEACCERGIRVSFLTSTGRPTAMLSSPMLTATVLTRREQLAAYGDRRGAEIARAVVRGKLGNQAALLKYFGKYQKAAAPDIFAQLTECVGAIAALRRDVAGVAGERVDDLRGALLAIEGAAGRHYWSGVRALLAGRIEFGTREHRGATDPINSALNYGYGILYAQVWGAVMNAGLEPFGGFLHVDRPGKPSLVLDLVEEFRQPIVDRAVIAAASKGSRLDLEGGMLTGEARRGVASAVLDRLEGEATLHGRRYKLRSILQLQARSVASFLRGGPPYRSFAFKW
jgi:CRISPR-associated protein Cas1